MDRKTKFLLAESFYYLGIGRLLKCLPFAKVAPSLGNHMEETGYESIDSQQKTVKHISHAIYVMSNYTFWESQCLVKAIAAMKMLEKRGIDSTMYLGTGRDENGKLSAHAWLRSGSYIVTGAEGMEKFTVVAQFAKHMEGLNDETGIIESTERVKSHS
ncbi:lasso peptide biosynthesis B2 protein [Metabacillus indicus]|uniref:lasso peptide biosynthesis B2 protein n=1 Tax=Metabacillus indicus TaxID=246786 RepID=UPI003984567A